MSESWTLRAALPPDAPDFAAAAERFFCQTYGHDPGHAAILQRHCAAAYAPEVIAGELGAPGSLAWVAQAEGRIIAIAQMQVSPPMAHVERLYLDGAWHGRGLAQALLQTMLGAALAHGCRAVQLGVWAGNDRALAFYRRHGFAEVGTTPLHLGGQVFDDILMEKSLP